MRLFSYTCMALNKETSFNNAALLLINVVHPSQHSKITFIQEKTNKQYVLCIVLQHVVSLTCNSIIVFLTIKSFTSD